MRHPLILAAVMLPLRAFAAPEFIPLDFQDPIPMALSADGSTLVGKASGQAFRWTRDEGLVGLGFLVPTCPDSRANSVSADGSVIVGYSCLVQNTSVGAFRWTSAEGMVALVDSNSGLHADQATAVSADGSTIVGTSLHTPPDSTISEAFRWTDDDGLVGLGDLPGSFFDSAALFVSADGSTVVGKGRTAVSGPQGQAFRWTQQTGMVALGSVIRSTARAISTDGSVVVGHALTTSFGDLEAFRWSEDGGYVNLGSLPAGGDVVARDVSGDGDVVVGQSRAEAFRWTSEGGMVGLGDLPGGDFESEAMLVSEDGSIIVGYGLAEGDNSLNNKTIFVWDEQHGMRPLDQVVPIPSGWLDETPGCFIQRMNIETMSADGRFLAGRARAANCTEKAWIANISSAACDDGLDDDGDGLADLADPGCADVDDDSEHEATLPCDDGVDNDGDALIDFPGDIGCKSLTHVENPQCQDGLDNDSDGKIDFDGGASLNDGIPLGTIDPGCEGKSFKPSEVSAVCGLGTEIALVLALVSRWGRRKTAR